eukprot:1230231-Rhodomonas_salina.1
MAWRLGTGGREARCGLSASDFNVSNGQVAGKQSVDEAAVAIALNMTLLGQVGHASRGLGVEPVPGPTVQQGRCPESSSPT